MTLSFDHALIDGAPATHFTGRLKELIESGYGLAESEVALVFVIGAISFILLAFFARDAARGQLPVPLGAKEI